MGTVAPPASSPAPAPAPPKSRLSAGPAAAGTQRPRPSSDLPAAGRGAGLSAVASTPSPLAPAPSADSPPPRDRLIALDADDRKALPGDVASSAPPRLPGLSVTEPADPRPESGTSTLLRDSSSSSSSRLRSKACTTKSFRRTCWALAPSAGAAAPPPSSFVPTPNASSAPAEFVLPRLAMRLRRAVRDTSLLAASSFPALAGACKRAMRTVATAPAATRRPPRPGGRPTRRGTRDRTGRPSSPAPRLDRAGAGQGGPPLPPTRSETGTGPQGPSAARASTASCEAAFYPRSAPQEGLAGPRVEEGATTGQGSLAKSNPKALAKAPSPRCPPRGLCRLIRHPTRSCPEKRTSRGRGHSLKAICEEARACEATPAGCRGRWMPQPTRDFRRTPERARGGGRGFAEAGALVRMHGRHLQRAASQRSPPALVT